MATAHLTLIGKPGCHLCDDARDLVSSVVTKLADDVAAPTITFEERSILDDAELHERYLEDIPVLLINGKVHNYWRIDPVRLRAALLEVS
ncbi:glutaredoxin family protein [Cryobacterium glaciale]|uniref:Glutaredoxin family protein n=1 Tax=Cryobacterium glaciale TaxID=1259145 RepID=A0A4R8UQC3_9MICO|nr:glutaredoxin family protein [Cryobacterium glaciale]TFB67770.1 glutaredoxin family protein [Cryobacterium glaciale]